MVMTFHQLSMSRVYLVFKSLRSGCDARKILIAVERGRLLLIACPDIIDEVEGIETVANAPFHNRIWLTRVPHSQRERGGSFPVLLFWTAIRQDEFLTTAFVKAANRKPTETVSKECSLTTVFSVRHLSELPVSSSSSNWPRSRSWQEAADTEDFYTASWGSPYSHPVSGSTPPYRPLHHGSSRSDVGVESPIRKSRIDALWSSGGSNRQLDAVVDSITNSYDPSTETATTPERQTLKLSRHTREFIKGSPQGQEASRHRLWPRRSSLRNEAVVIQSEEALGNSKADSRRSTDAGSSDGDPRTPTLKSYIRRKDPSSWQAALTHSRSWKRHRVKDSDDTLRQEDIGNEERFSSKSQASLDTMLASKYADTSSPLREEHADSPSTSRRAGVTEKSPSTHTTTSPQVSPTRVKKVDLLEQESPISAEQEIPVRRGSRSAAMRSAMGLAPRRRITGRGRTFVVVLPLYDDSDALLDHRKPLTPSEVTMRLKAFEEKGYNTRGFDLEDSPTLDNGKEFQSQSRKIYPEAEDIPTVSNDKCTVSIPNRAEWEAYVNRLNEEKLRALGVTLGNDPNPLGLPPTPPKMSRQVSSQYPPLPFSPPLPTSSTTSNHVTQPHGLFSPPYLTAGSTNPSSQVASVASPVSSHTGKTGVHGPRLSSAPSGPDSRLGTPTQYVHESMMTPAQSTWTANRAGSHPDGRWDSSLPLSSNVRDPRTSLSHQSSFNVSNSVYKPVDEHMSQSKSQQTHNSRFSPLGVVGKDGFRDQDGPVFYEEGLIRSVSANAAVSSPKFHRHRHNVSESLQREIDEAEYHLEHAIERELDEDDRERADVTSPFDTGDLLLDSLSVPGIFGISQQSGTPVTREDEVRSSSTRTPERPSQQRHSSLTPETPLHHPQPHNRLHSISQQQYLSNPEPNVRNQDLPSSSELHQQAKLNEKQLDSAESKVEVSPSAPIIPDSSHSIVSTAPRGVSIILSGPCANLRQVDEDHVEKMATSPPHEALNSVKSSTSKLNVEAKEFRFNPTSSFAPGNFTFSGSNFQPLNSLLGPQAHSAWAAGVIDPRPKAIESKLNVEAVAFRPSGVMASTIPHGDFSFSSSTSAFGPGMERHTSFPKTDEEIQVTGHHLEEELVKESNSAEKIFQFAETVKPAKSSKAVPIARPNERLQARAREREPDSEEDEFGRITEGKGRRKKMRHGDDGDEVPQFALPSHPLTGTAQSQSPDRDITPIQVLSASGKESVEPIIEREPSQKLAIRPPLQPRPRSTLEDSPDYDGKSWGRYEFERIKEARAFNDARPTTPPPLSNSRQFSIREREEQARGVDDDLTAARPPASPVDQGARPVTTPKSSEKPAKSQGLSATAKPFEFRPNQGHDEFSFTGGNIFQSSGPVEQAEHETSSAGLLQETAPNFGVRNLEEEILTRQGSEPKEEEQDENIRYSITSDLQQPQNVDEVASIGSLDKRGLDEESGRSTPESTFSRASLPSIEDQTTSQRLGTGPLSRSDAPSPSPRRVRQYPFSPDDVMPPPARPYSTRHVLDPRDAQTGSPLHKLNRTGDRQPSDWDDFMSPSEDFKLQTPAKYLDSRIDRLLGGVLQERLVPLEAALVRLQRSIELREQDSSRAGDGGVARGKKLDSDADDEDDDAAETGFQRRPVSPRKDRKLEKLRAVMLEVLAAQDSNPTKELSNLRQEMVEMRRSLAQSEAAMTHQEELRNILNESSKGERQAQIQAGVADESGEVDRLRSQVEALESTLNQSKENIEGLIHERTLAESKLIDAQHRLELAAEDKAQQKESTRDKEEKLHALDSERQQSLIESQMRTALLEGAQENLQKISSNLSTENVALQANLHEARVAESRSRGNLERAENENRELRRLIDTLKTQLEETVRAREKHRGKFDKMQSEISAASQKIAQEQAMWRKTDTDHRSRHEVLGARLEAEARTRERLEREIERLEVQERDAMKLRVQLEHARGSHDQLQSIVNALRLGNIDYQKAAAKYEHENEEARESGIMEVQRTRMLMHADIEAANNQVNLVRANLESDVARVKADLERAQLQAVSDKQGLEFLLEDASLSKRDALHEAHQSRESAVLEQHRKYERQLEDITFQHERSLRNAVEDKERTESHLLERLSLSDAKSEHQQALIVHLEDKLEIAKSAASAAVQAAQKASESTTRKQHHDASVPLAKDSDIPERISPQALRESILVLQEQLQEREGRIERLESDLARVDQDAPSKINERDTEIAWLRELLGVRIADLEDIIKCLSQTEYDREAVKDAAIRLKANLQMEQQERERAMAGGQSFPSLASISSFASPKAVLPLAAAWGNWRKGRETSVGNLSEIASGGSQTPSKASPSAQSFLSGLLTPPSTTLKPTPRGHSDTGSRRGSSSRSGRTPLTRSPASTRVRDKAPAQAAPSTPPLLRQGSYDQDATSSTFGAGGMHDDDESTVDGMAGDESIDNAFEPFGPVIR
ncbi:MAG: hypothetical protein M1833_003196 [Piccolia ochrophora]|nr:MAG: hypothetical protein M1833_003196 [Piccolia ochrophora]